MLEQRWMLILRPFLGRMNRAFGVGHSGHFVPGVGNRPAPTPWIRACYWVNLNIPLALWERHAKLLSKTGEDSFMLYFLFRCTQSHTLVHLLHKNGNTCIVCYRRIIARCCRSLFHHDCFHVMSIDIRGGIWLLCPYPLLSFLCLVVFVSVIKIITMHSERVTQSTAITTRRI